MKSIERNDRRCFLSFFTPLKGTHYTRPAARTDPSGRQRGLGASAHHKVTEGNCSMEGFYEAASYTQQQTHLHLIKWGKKEEKRKSTIAQLWRQRVSSPSPYVTSRWDCLRDSITTDLLKTTARVFLEGRRNWPWFHYEKKAFLLFFRTYRAIMPTSKTTGLGWFIFLTRQKQQTRQHSNAGQEDCIVLVEVRINGG